LASLFLEQSVFLPKLTHAAVRFGCDSWPTCYFERRPRCRRDHL